MRGRPARATITAVAFGSSGHRIFLPDRGPLRRGAPSNLIVGLAGRGPAEPSHESSMVIALFALSLLMIVGGVAAVVQGFPYVRLETGLAMVIGGTSAASAGMVLLGVGAAVLQLTRIERGLRARREAGLPEGVRGPDLPLPAPREAPALPAVRPSAAGLNGSLAAGTAFAGADVRPPRPESAQPEPAPPTEPDLFAHPEDRPGHSVQEPVQEHVQEPFHEPLRESVREEASREQARQALAEPVPEPAPEPRPDPSPQPEPPRAEPAPPLRPGLDASEPAPPEPPPAGRPPRQAVGSYASGANTYTMYSDGTIDAQTPQGHFTFQSLDELKDFVASGESGARGAA